MYRSICIEVYVQKQVIYFLDLPVYFFSCTSCSVSLTEFSGVNSRHGIVTRQIIVALSQNVEPYTQNVKPYTQNIQPYTQNVEPYTQNVKPYTQNIEPYTQNVEPYTQNVEPTQNFKVQNVMSLLKETVHHFRKIEGCLVIIGTSFHLPKMS